ncbi:MAG: MarR family winged helix-turn-helix transcriptional regulator [Actinomycetes bacterium]
MAGPKRAPPLRAELVELVQRLGLESDRVGQVFAAQQGLHRTDLEALLHVMRSEARGQPITAGQLAAEMRLTSGAITGVVDRLARGGHLDRRRDSRDRRRVYLHYGEAGYAVASEFFGPLERLTTAVMDHFDDDELEVVRRFLVGMTDALATHVRATQEPGAGVTGTHSGPTSTPAARGRTPP